MATYQCKKIIENCNFVGARAHKVGKIAFDPSLTLSFSIFREREKSKLYTLKKVGLTKFKEIL